MGPDKQRWPLRKRAWTTVWIVIFFIVISVAIYIRSPYALVKQVVVEGATDETPAVVARDAGIRVGQNLLQIPIDQARHRLLSDFPILRSVSIQRDMLQQRVVIAVKERTLAGILSAGGSLYRVLADGTVLDRDPEGIGVDTPILSTSFPVYVSLGQRLGNADLVSICRQLPSIPSSLMAQLSQLYLTTVQGSPVVTAYTRDGFEVQMPVTGLAHSLALYASIRARLAANHVAPGIIDIMSGQQAIYKGY